MDELDKIFLDNKDAFQEEPPPGHFERFKERLSNKGEGKRKRSANFYWRMAAILIIGLFIANLFVHIFPRQDEVASEMIHSEILDTEIYYTNQINYGISELKELSSKGILESKENELISTELSEMDSLLTHLKEEYKSNPNDERIIAAMVEHYQVKLEIINTILNELNRVKIQKNNSYEDTEI